MFALIGWLMLWAGIPLLWVLLTIASEKRAPFWGATGALLLVMILEFTTDIKAFTYAFDHPVNALMIIVAYVIFGNGYAVAKWRSFIRLVNEQIQDAALENNGAVDLARNPVTVAGHRINKVPLQVRAYKADFMTWALFWPMSFVWTVINDPIRRLYNAIYNALASRLQRMSDDMFKDAPVK